MKVLFVLAAVVAVLNAAVFQVPIASAGSKRAQLMKKQGEWKKYLSKLAISSQPFIDYYDDFYLGIISLGTPKQNFTIVLDTGSSNLWVIDSMCKTLACKGSVDNVKHRFNSSKSSTYRKDGHFFNIQYGSGSCYGILGSDTLSFGGIEVNNQVFGRAMQIADVFGEQPVDGILGLGWPSLAVEEVVPPIQNALPQLSSPLFTVWLDRKIKLSEGGNAGLITYGGLDHTHCAPEINYIKLSSLSYWKFPIDGFSVGDYRHPKSSEVISDTGTSWIAAPEADTNAIAKQIGAVYDYDQGLFTVDCNAELPDWVFKIAGKNYPIPSKEYVLDLGLGNNKCVVTVFSQDGGGFGPEWILGDTFIRTYCQIYDVGNKQIGFAVAKHDEV